MERKARFIGQLMRGRLDVREVADIGDTALSYAEVKALAAGDPRLVEQAEVSTELARLVRLERAWQRDRDRLGGEARRLAAQEASLRRELGQVHAARALRDAHAGEAYVVLGQRYEKRTGAGAALLAHLRSEAGRLAPGREASLGAVGAVGGIAVGATAWATPASRGADLALVGVPRSGLRLQGPDLDGDHPHSVVVAMEARLRRLDELPATITSELGETEREQAGVAGALARPFAHHDAIRALRQRGAELEAELAALAGTGRQRDEPVGRSPTAGLPGEPVGDNFPGRPPASGPLLEQDRRQVAVLDHDWDTGIDL